MDGGATFTPQGPLLLTSDPAFWTTVESGLLVDGLMGDQAANRHTNKGSCNPLLDPLLPRCVDFYLAGSAVHDAGDGRHTVRAAVPEPTSLGLVGLALAALGWARRRSRR